MNKNDNNHLNLDNWSLNLEDGETSVERYSNGLANNSLDSEQKEKLPDQENKVSLGNIFELAQKMPKSKKDIKKEQEDNKYFDFTGFVDNNDMVNQADFHNLEHLGNIVIPSNADEIFKNNDLLGSGYHAEPKLPLASNQSMNDEHNNYLLDSSRLNRLSDLGENTKHIGYDELLSSAMSSENIAYLAKDKDCFGVFSRRRRKMGNPYLNKNEFSENSENPLAHIVLPSDSLSDLNPNTNQDNFYREQYISRKDKPEWQEKIKDYLAEAGCDLETVPLEEILNIPKLAKKVEQTSFEEIDDFQQFFNYQRGYSTPNIALGLKKKIQLLESRNKVAAKHMKIEGFVETVAGNFFKFYDNSEQTRDVPMWDHGHEIDESLLTHDTEHYEDKELWIEFDFRTDLIDLSQILAENYNIEVIQGNQASSIFIKSSDGVILQAMTVNSPNVNYDLLCSMQNGIKNNNFALSMGRRYGIFAVENKENWFGSTSPQLNISTSISLSKKIKKIK